MALITSVAIVCWLPVRSSSKKSAQPEQDQSVSAAAHLGAEAEKLRSQWQEGALRNAITKYKEALTIWQSAGDIRGVTRTLEPAD